jgi:ABC-type uncharacterized transport system substrate-binding protein
VRQGVGLVLLVFGVAHWPSGATAHPHVFIDCEMDLLFSGDRIDGIRLTWTFDDLFSGFILQEFDRDRSGSLSPAEVHQIEAKHLAEFRRVNFFTVVTLNGNDVTPGPARDFTATVAKGLVTYQFTLPLSAPLRSWSTIRPTTLRTRRRGPVRGPRRSAPSWWSVAWPTTRAV